MATRYELQDGEGNTEGQFNILNFTPPLYELKFWPALLKGLKEDLNEIVRGNTTAEERREVVISLQRFEDRRGPELYGKIQTYNQDLADRLWEVIQEEWK